MSITDPQISPEQAFLLISSWASNYARETENLKKKPTEELYLRFFDPTTGQASFTFRAQRTSRGFWNDLGFRLKRAWSSIFCRKQKILVLDTHAKTYVTYANAFLQLKPEQLAELLKKPIFQGITPQHINELTNFLKTKLASPNRRTTSAQIKEFTDLETKINVLFQDAKTPPVAHTAKKAKGVISRLLGTKAKAGAIVGGALAAAGVALHVIQEQHMVTQIIEQQEAGVLTLIGRGVLGHLGKAAVQAGVHVLNAHVLN